MTGDPQPIRATVDARARSHRVGDAFWASPIEAYAVAADTLRIVGATAGARTRLGRTTAELLGIEYGRISDGADVRRLRSLAGRGAAADATVVFECSHVRRDGTRYAVEVEAAATADALPTLLLVARDICARREREADLAAAALTDPLTGVANRRALARRLDEEIDRSRRHGRPLGVVAVDVDHFKSVNDRYGHAEGDRALIEVARRLRAVCRTCDLVARPGGEEFVLIVVEADADGASAIAERARNAIAAAPVGDVAITVSAGVAALDERDDPASLLARADAALYAAKASGRNLVVQAPDRRLPAGPRRARRTRLPGPVAPAAIEDYIALALQPDRAALRTLVRAVEERHGAVALFDQLLRPALEEVGRRWSTGALTVGQEHLVTGLTEQVLVERLRRTPTALERPFVVLAQSPENAHTVGLTIVAECVELAGAQPVTFGQGQSLLDVARTAASLGAVAMGVSVATDRDLRAFEESLDDVRAGLAGIPLLVGGGAIVARAGWQPPVGVVAARSGDEAIAAVRLLVEGAGRAGARRLRLAGSA